MPPLLNLFNLALSRQTWTQAEPLFLVLSLIPSQRGSSELMPASTMNAHHELPMTWANGYSRILLTPKGTVEGSLQHRDRDVMARSDIVVPTGRMPSPGRRGLWGVVRQRRRVRLPHHAGRATRIWADVPA